MRTLTLLAAAGFLLAAGCDLYTGKKKPTATAATSAAASSDAAAAPAPAPGAGKNTNYQPGAGPLVNAAKAGKRTEVLNDMRTLGTYITQWELENNRMPTKPEVAELVKQDQKISKLINEGTIILTGTTDRAGLWAYEVEADTKGGIGLVAGVPNRYDAATIKQYLGQR